MLLNSIEAALGFLSYCPCSPITVLLPRHGQKAGERQKTNSAFYKKVKRCTQLYRTAYDVIMYGLELDSWERATFQAGCT